MSDLKSSSRPSFEPVILQTRNGPALNKFMSLGTWDKSLFFFVPKGKDIEKQIVIHMRVQFCFPYI